MKTTATAVFVVLGLLFVLFVAGTGCERPPIPAGDSTNEVGVLPSCQSLDHISGNWSMTLYYGGTVYDQNAMAAWLDYFSCSSVLLHFGWTNYGWIATEGWYSESTVVSQETFTFDFVGGDGARYIPQYYSPTLGCGHAPGANTWRCNMWREYPPYSGNRSPVIGTFLKQ